MSFLFLAVIYFGGRREGERWNWAWVLSARLARHIGYLELLLKLMFVNPPELPEQTTKALPVRLVIPFIYSWMNNSVSLWYFLNCVYYCVFIFLWKAGEISIWKTVALEEHVVKFLRLKKIGVFSQLWQSCWTLLLFSIRGFDCRTDICNRQNKNSVFWYSLLCIKFKACFTDYFCWRLFAFFISTASDYSKLLAYLKARKVMSCVLYFYLLLLFRGLYFHLMVLLCDLVLLCFFFLNPQ